MSRYLLLPQVKHVFAKFRSVKIEDIDGKFALALATVTQSAIQPKHYTQEGPSEWFGFDYFWDLLQDGAAPNMSLETFWMIVNQLNGMFQGENTELARVLFMEKCIDKLKRHESVPISIHISQNLIGTWPFTKLIDPHLIHVSPGLISQKPEGSSKTFLWLEETHKFSSVVLACLEKSADEVLAYATQLAQSGQPLVNIQFKTPGKSRIQWYFWVKSFVDFLEMYFPLGRYEITAEQAARLWTSLVLKAVTEDVRTMGLRFFEANFHNDVRMPRVRTDIPSLCSSYAH